MILHWQGLTLTELEARFVGHPYRDAQGFLRHRNDTAIADTFGLFFLCPSCLMLNMGTVGTHWVLCWRPEVPLQYKPGPGRWNFLGTGLHDLSLDYNSSSIALNGCPTDAHFWIRNGIATDRKEPHRGGQTPLWPTQARR